MLAFSLIFACWFLNVQNVVAQPARRQAEGTVATVSHNRIVLRNRNPR